MKVTKKTLIRIIREELAAGPVRPDPEKTARAINRTSLQPQDAVEWIEDLEPYLDLDTDDGRLMGHGGSAKMARGQLFTIAKNAQSLHDRLKDDDEIPEWVQSKIAAMIDDVHELDDHLSYKMHQDNLVDDVPLDDLDLTIIPGAQ